MTIDREGIHLRELARVQKQRDDLQAQVDRLKIDLFIANGKREQAEASLEKLQPLLSVIGDWDWPAIVEDGPSHYPDALASAARALAYVATERAKERSDG